MFSYISHSNLPCTGDFCISLCFGNKNGSIVLVASNTNPLFLVCIIWVLLDGLQLLVAGLDSVQLHLSSHLGSQAKGQAPLWVTLFSGLRQEYREMLCSLIESCFTDAVCSHPIGQNIPHGPPQNWWVGDLNAQQHFQASHMMGWNILQEESQELGLCYLLYFIDLTIPLRFGIWMVSSVNNDK